jgi:hypothetical protein
MLERCKNCKYWTRTEKEEHNSGLYGDCNSSKFEYEIDRESLVDGDKLLYQDYEGFSAGFVTGEEFGCIHFKEAQDGPSNNRI